MTSVVTNSPMFIRAVFEGRNGVGGISVPGLVAGDVILQAQAGPSGSGIPGGPGTYQNFENGLATISVNDEIQQTSAIDMTGIVLTFYLLRWV